MNKLKQLFKSMLFWRHSNFLKRLKRAMELAFGNLDSVDPGTGSENAQVVLPIETNSNNSNNVNTQEYLWPWNYTPKEFPDCLPSGRPWPKISIVTPSYNYGEYIEETIRSVILQGYPNLEYIVVDGDSTDNTKQILERYKSEISICISEPDEGQTNALNKGFKQATGDILTWLNSDDQHLPDTLKQVAIAFDTYRCDLVVGGCQLIQDRNGSILSTHHCSLPVLELLPLPYQSMLDFGGDWLSGKFFMGPEVFWSRCAWETAGGMLNENLNFGMDYDLWLRMARAKMVCCHIPYNLAIFRIHHRQKTIFSGKIEDYPEYLAISRYYQVLDNIEVPDRDRNLVAFPRVDGSGTELVDIKATLPLERFADRPLVLYTTAYGKYYLPFDGTLRAVTSKIRLGKLESPAVIEVARTYVHPGSTVIEVGTRFGQTTVLLAGITGSQGQVLAFESDEYLFHALQKTLVANNLHNVRPYLRRVVDKNVSQIGEEIYAITLDDMGITHPVSLLKVSADGGGLKVLEGAMRTILTHKPVIILQDKPSELLSQFLHNIAYKIEKSLDADWLLLKADVSQQESLFIPDAKERCSLEIKFPAPNLCKFLKFRSEVLECTEFLHRNGFVSHNLTCKDWDIAHIISEVGDGNFLDMGSSDSYILKNLALKNIKGDLYGIDLSDPDVPIPRVQYLKGDLMNTGLPSEHFANISCLSVLEHEVDFERFAVEVSRLLHVGGRLFVTFDYWEPKIIPPIRLYNLAWQPLDKQKVCELIEVCNRYGLRLVNAMDWELGEPVIQYGYYAPHPDMKYTFGMAVFEKINV